MFATAYPGTDPMGLTIALFVEMLNNARRVRDYLDGKGSMMDAMEESLSGEMEVEAILGELGAVERGEGN